LLHLVGDLFELNVKLRCQTVNMSDGLEGMWEGTVVASLNTAFYQHLPGVIKKNHDNFS